MQLAKIFCMSFIKQSFGAYLLPLELDEVPVWDFEAVDSWDPVDSRDPNLLGILSAFPFNPIFLSRSRDAGLC